MVERFKKLERRLGPVEPTVDFVCSEISSNRVSIVVIRSESENVGKLTES